MKKIFIKLFAPILCLTLLLFVNHQSFAMSFSPLEASYNSSGSGSTNIYKLENKTSETVAVEIFAKKRVMNSDGSDLLTDAEDDFNIYPSQIILKPNQEQSVRVQYMGSPNVEYEQSYRIIAEQLPINIDEPEDERVAMKLLSRYVTSAYVASKKVNADLSVKGIKNVIKDGQKMLAITIENQGDGHVIFKDFILKIDDSEISQEQLKGLTGENILAKTTREFLVINDSTNLNLNGKATLVFDKKFN